MLLDFLPRRCEAVDRRRFEMHQYRAVLARMRQGDSDRDIAAARLMGRNKLARFHALATKHGWLASGSALPDDATIAAALGVAKRARSTISSVQPYRARVERWILASTRYIGSEGTLHVRSGPFAWRIPVSSITRITPTRSPISSPALSLRRLRVEYDAGKHILVSPVD